MASALILYGVGKAVNELVIKPYIDKKIKDSIKDYESENLSLSQISQTQNLPTVRGASNQNANGKPVPFIFGKTLFTPYICGNGYTTIEGTDGEDEYFTTELLLGYSDLIVQDIRITKQ